MKKSHAVKMKERNLQGFTRYLAQHQIGKDLLYFLKKKKQTNN